MSMHADFVSMFRDAKERYSLTERQCAELLQETFEILQWDCYDTGSEYVLEKEIAMATVEMFGHKPNLTA